MMGSEEEVVLAALAGLASQNRISVEPIDFVSEGMYEFECLASSRCWIVRVRIHFVFGSVGDQIGVVAFFMR